MTPRGHADRLEARRRLAVTRVEGGWKREDVAASLGVSLEAVSNRVAARKASGDDGPADRPHRGAKPKPPRRQERAVSSPMAGRPRAFGHETDPWTTKRLAEVIRRRHKVRSNCPAARIRRRGYTPREPEVEAAGRSNPAIARPVAEDWRRIKDEPGTSGPGSSRSTRAGSSPTPRCGGLGR